MKKVFLLLGATFSRAFRSNSSLHYLRSSGGLIILTVLIMLIVSACQSTGSGPIIDKKPPTNNGSASNLEKVAKILAQTISNEDVRNAIKEAAGERFDSDTEVLYSDISNVILPDGTTFATQMATAHVSSLGTQSNGLTTAAVLNELQTLSSANPRLQIAVRGDNENWDTETVTPLVAFEPENEDASEIKAYDAEGKVHLLDAKVAPDQPIIVVGNNERIDESGKVKSYFLPTINSAQEVKEPPTTPPDQNTNIEVQGGRCARMYYIWITNDHEPWWKGGAELYLIAKSDDGNIYYHGGFTSVDKTNRWYYVYARTLGCAASNVTYYWYEQDGWSLDFTASYNGISLGVKIDDDDDFMGAIKLPYTSYPTWRMWNAGEVYFYPYH